MTDDLKTRGGGQLEELAELREKLEELESERERIAAQLHESEEIRRSITECSPDYVMLVQPDGRVVLLNRPFPGVSADEVIGKVIYDYLPRDYRQAMMDCFSRVLLTRQSDSYEAEYQAPDGTASRYEARVGPVVKDGEVAMLTVSIRDITDRAEAEAGLRESEERYRALVEANPDLMFRIHRDGTYLDYRAINESDLFIPAEEIVGSNIRDLPLPAHFQERSLTAIAEALDTREVQTLEYKLPMPDGPREFEARLVACAPDEVIAIVRDVTERKRAEEGLRESQRRYALATGAAKVGVWDWNVKTGEFYLDPNIKRILGYSDEEIPNDLERWVEYVHPEDREPVMKAAQETLDGKTPEYRYEHRMRHKDGSYRWVMARGTVIRDRDGNVLRMIGTDADITDRKAAEESLKRHKVILETIFDHLPAMVILYDTDGKVLIENREVERVLGWSIEALGHMGPLAHCYPDKEYRQEFLDHMRRTQSEWRDFSTRVHDGRSLEISWATVSLPDGRRIGIGQDMTERRQGERDREELEAQLRQAQKMEALGTLAGGIAHDLNNILLAITGFTELALYDGALTSRVQRDNLEQVLIAARRAGHLVERILEFSRQRRQEVKALDACAVVEEALKLLRASIPANIEFREDLDRRAGKIRADENQIQQVILNLGTNAAHAMGDEAGILEVKVDSYDMSEARAQRLGGVAQGRYVRITVRDSGHGIDPKIVKRIYDPFFTTKRVGEGTGLGLSVVHGIVQSHEGVIDVESQPGMGTKFEVFFPAVEDTESEPVFSGDAVYRGRERVLLVDDEPQVAKVTQLHLERLGYVVTMKTDSVAALELFRSQPDAFDIVVTDQTMPQLSGLNLVRELRSIRPNIPVVLTTGYSGAVTEEALAETRIKTFLRKPYPGHALARAVRQTLEDAETAD